MLVSHFVSSTDAAPQSVPPAQHPRSTRLPTEPLSSVPLPAVSSQEPTSQSVPNTSQEEPARRAAQGRSRSSWEKQRTPGWPVPVPSPWSHLVEIGGSPVLSAPPSLPSCDLALVHLSVTLLMAERLGRAGARPSSAEGGGGSLRHCLPRGPPTACGQCPRPHSLPTRKPRFREASDLPSQGSEVMTRLVEDRKSVF